MPIKASITAVIGGAIVLALLTIATAGGHDKVGGDDRPTAVASSWTEAPRPAAAPHTGGPK